MEILNGIRVIEVTEWGFVPSCATVLADWGADVIKIEHPARGDSMRGLITSGMIPGAKGVNFFVEQLFRNKKSVGIDFTKPEGLQVLYKLVEKADVFVTSFLPEARERLKITYEDLKKVNPKIIYARGHGQGHHLELVVELFAEAPGGDQGGEVLRAGSDDAHVQRHRLASTAADQAAPVERGGQAQLQLGVELRHLVEKQRAAVGLFQQTVLHGTAVLRAEQGLGGVLAGDAARCHGDEGPLAPRSLLVQPARQRLLARAGLTQHEQPGVVRGQAFELGAQGLHGARGTDRLQRHGDLPLEALVLGLLADPVDGELGELPAVAFIHGGLDPDGVLGRPVLEEILEHRRVLEHLDGDQVDRSLGAGVDAVDRVRPVVRRAPPRRRVDHRPGVLGGEVDHRVVRVGAGETMRGVEHKRR